MKNILVLTKSQCSGCGACLSVCGNSAIHLEINPVGYYQAHVDKGKCTNCGLCQNVCARFREEPSGVDIRTSSVFTVQSIQPETIKRCSSGGAAHEIAKWALSHQYLLCGAVYDLETNTVKHAITDDIRLLDGSKYLQSDTSVFSEVIHRAMNGKCFVVFGVPCQMAGLARAAELKKCRDKLFLVEIFCHGVPTYKLWNRECELVKKKLKCNQFDEVRFRYKKYGWHSYCLRFRKDGKIHYGSREGDFFYRAYFEDILLNGACLDCKARQETSLADIRLGDYWGKRYQDRNDGVSVAFCNNEKAASILTQLSIQQLPAGTAEEVLLCQNMEGYQCQALHDETMEILIKDGIEAALRYYRARLPMKQKIKSIALLLFSFLPGFVRVKVRAIMKR